MLMKIVNNNFDYFMVYILRVKGYICNFVTNDDFPLQFKYMDRFFHITLINILKYN